MKSLARELGRFSIRVNSVNPTTVDTPMVNSVNFFRWLLPDVEEPSRRDVEQELAKSHVLPVGWIDAVDVSNAVMWLCSEEARYVTGHALVIDAGATL
jgi:(+)-trans-carveol dehydrogenase